MLLMFDVDGTLVDTGGAGRRAMAAAFRRVTGVEGALEGVRLHGSTDPTILADVFRMHVGRPMADEAERDRLMAAYLSALDVELRASAEDYTVLPGAFQLPTAARQSGRFTVGLATGNVEAGAQRKLAHGGLWSLFDFGGYGSDARERSELIRQGIERGQVLAEKAHGRRFSEREVVVLGDTENDVLAARAVGAVSVGVLVGSRYRQALLAAKPDVVVESLMDPELWSFLGLSPSRPAPSDEA